ncbi:MAG: CbiX/SirB N-terminal domain-containing protein [Halolamina sp.]
MTHDTLLLIGRASTATTAVLDRQAERLDRRGVVDDVRVATYDAEPVRELKAEFRALAADRVFAVPAVVAHSYETTDAIPAALSYVPGEVCYCEPLGGSPNITDALVERAADHYEPAEDVSLVLVGLGSSSKPFPEQAVEHHAARIRESAAFGEVVSSYLMQNPAVECVRYNVTNERAVAVPVFVTPSTATTERIPAKLELDRGGMAYADVLGDHPEVTDAIHATVERRRVLADEGGTHSFEDSLVESSQPVATDGEGR